MIKLYYPSGKGQILILTDEDIVKECRGGIIAMCDVKELLQPVVHDDNHYSGMIWDTFVNFPTIIYITLLPNKQVPGSMPLYSFQILKSYYDLVLDGYFYNYLHSPEMYDKFLSRFFISENS